VEPTQLPGGGRTVPTTFNQDLEGRDDEIRRLRTLLQVSRVMNSGVTHDRMIEQINEAVRRHLHADRLTVFFYDGKSDELYSYIASGLKPGEIRIPSDGGIAGYVFHSGEMVCVEDAYEDPRFNPEVDRRTGYRTRSMLTMHITNRQGVRIGVVQALNKFEGQGSFTQEDMIFLWETVDQISELYTALEEALSHLLIFSVDTEFEIMYTSPAAEPFTGHNPGDLRGRKITELVHPDDLSYFESRFQRLFAGATIEPAEFRIVTKDDELKWMRSTSRPLVEDDIVVGVQGQMVDVTERKLLENELREAQKIESIGRLAGGIAHDFNNLLVPILGYTDVAAGKLTAGHPASGFYDRSKTLQSGRKTSHTSCWPLVVNRCSRCVYST
jgi:PAS domain S-box-containing protein